MMSETEFLYGEVRRATRAARTEDEYLDALRSAGSLSAGLAIVATPASLPPFTHDEAFRERVAELLAGGRKINGRWTNIHDFDELRAT